jgi:hypothetical protein
MEELVEMVGRKGVRPIIPPEVPPLLKVKQEHNFSTSNAHIFFTGFDDFVLEF